jgi:hypothetical protein
MALILVIESDRRQTSKLTILARGQLHADLLIVDNVTQALAKLDECDPDLILLSPGISGRDQLALGDRLLEIEEQGLRIQTLNIPALGLAGQRARVPQKGAPGRAPMPRSRPSQSDAMDPVVFGVQISTLLDRIASERAASGTVARRHQPAVVVADDEEAETIETTSIELPSSTDTRVPKSGNDWSELLEAMRREIEVAQSTPQSPTEVESQELNLDEFARIIDTANYRSGKPEKRDSRESSSQGDSNSPTVENGTAAKPETPEPAQSPVAANAPARKKKVRRVPAQDEFGFFDPQQCGLSALFAKLDTITPPGKTVTPKKPS